MGRTLEELGATMSAEEYGYWQAEYLRHPWGDYVVELGAGVVASTMANVNRGKNTKPYKVSDFMLLQKDPVEVQAEEADPREVFKKLNNKNG